MHVCECDLGVLALEPAVWVYNDLAWGFSSTKRPSLNNVPSQIEQEPDQSITTLKGSQSFPWCI